MNNEKNEIRRLKNGGWFWINKKVLQLFSRSLKASGLAVYNALASYANFKNQTCFPTQRSIARHLGLSVRTVNRKIRLLKDFKLIKFKKIRGRCFYTLLRIDTPKGKRLYDKKDTRDRTPGKSDNNKSIRINNKNKKTNENFNNFKPLGHLIKKYDKKTAKNHRN